MSVRFGDRRGQDDSASSKHSLLSLLAIIAASCEGILPEVFSSGSAPTRSGQGWQGDEDRVATAQSRQNSLPSMFSITRHDLSSPSADSGRTRTRTASHAPAATGLDGAVIHSLQEPAYSLGN